MEYEFRPTNTSKQAITAYAKLLSEVFTQTNKFTFDYLDWQYRQNPNGTVVGFDAYLDNEMAAHYVCIPVSYEIKGEIVKGLLSLNTATHPKHQGKGLFTRLAKKTFEEGRKQGYQFVIGVANQNSSYGFLNKLDFELIASLDVKIGLGNITSQKKQHSFKSHWDNNSLSWRLNNPDSTYFEKDGKAFIKANPLGIYAQLFSFDQSHTIQLSNTFMPFKMWVGLGSSVKAKGMFIPLPQKLKPAPLNLIYRDLSGQYPCPKASDVFFELIDFDVY